MLLLCIAWISLTKVNGRGKSVAENRFLVNNNQLKYWV